MFLNIKKVVEVRGKRQSGKTTKLVEMFYDSLGTDNCIPLLVSADIRMKDINEVTKELGIQPDVILISPFHNEVYYVFNGEFNKCTVEEFLADYFKMDNIRMFVDNPSLPNTKNILAYIRRHRKIVELYYTTLNKYRRDSTFNLFKRTTYTFPIDAVLTRINVNVEDGLYFEIEEPIERGSAV